MKSAFTCMPCKLVTVQIEQDVTEDGTEFRRILMNAHMEDGSHHEITFIGSTDMELAIEEPGDDEQTQGS